MRKNIFVFVVCGADIHIQTLNYSIGHLRHFSNNEILVVTDKSRNSRDIEHDQILDIQTPTNLSDHQASIYLKVGLHKFVDLKHQYCYLDSDVVAVNADVDRIFELQSENILFASDHCSMRQFSPMAVTCTCIEDRESEVNTLENLEASYLDLEKQFHSDLRAFNEKYIPTEPTGFKNYTRLKEIIQEYSDANQWFLKSPPAFQFLLARIRPAKYNFEKFLASKGDYIWSDNTKQAFDSAGNLLYDANAEPPQHPSYYRHIKSNSSFLWSDTNTYWLNQKGEDIYSVANCEHLKQQIEEKFNVSPDPNWQHWNGGVFLFNKNAVPFMERWFENTMQIFNDNSWKTRDQGSLIATVWQLGLQSNNRIPQRYNLLADAQNRNLRFHPTKGISLNCGETYVEPVLIHVYHDFGKEGWNVWDFIVGKRSKSSLKGMQELEPNHIDDNKVVHGLWIGSELSSIELLTITSFINNGHEFNLWVYDEITTPLPDGVKLQMASAIIPEDQVFSYKNKNQFGHGKGSFAGFSDIFRYKLLFDKGGWWVDMDVCCLKPFHFKGQYLFRKHHLLPAVGNIMKCPKGSAVMKACYEEAIATVQAENTDWHKPITILNKYIEQFKLEDNIRSISNTDNWSDIVPLLNAKDISLPDWHAIHWANENWRARDIKKTVFVRNSAISKLLIEHEIEHEVTDKPINIARRLSLSSIFGKVRELTSSVKL